MPNDVFVVDKVRSPRSLHENYGRSDAADAEVRVQELRRQLDAARNAEAVRQAEVEELRGQLDAARKAEAAQHAEIRNLIFRNDHTVQHLRRELEAARKTEAAWQAEVQKNFTRQTEIYSARRKLEAARKTDAALQAEVQKLQAKNYVQKQFVLALQAKLRSTEELLSKSRSEVTTVQVEQAGAQQDDTAAGRGFAICAGPRVDEIKEGSGGVSETYAQDERAERMRSVNVARAANLRSSLTKRSETLQQKQETLRLNGCPKISCECGRDIFYDPAELSKRKQPKLYCTCRKVSHVRSIIKYTSKKSTTKKPITKKTTTNKSAGITRKQKK